MASPSTADLTGLFKDVYGDSLKDLIPQNLSLLPRVGFEVKEKLGGKFRQPVVVKSEQGVTYGASGSGAFDLQAPAAMQTVEAQVDAVNLVLSSSLDYESAARASSSKAAFAEATGLKVKHMTFGIRKRLEVSSWYGQSGLGVVEAIDSTGTNVHRFTITAATFAPLIWAGLAGAKLDYLTDNSTKVNTNAAMVVTKVDIANRYVYVSCAAADDSAIAGATIAGTNDTLVFASSYAGSDAWNDMLGIHGQLVTSGTVFNIDNSVYDLWAPNSFAVGGNLNYKGVQDAVATAVSRGLDEDCEVFISYKTFGHVAADMAALRVIDQSYDAKKAIAGHESIEFHGLNGKISITPSGFVWGGYGYVLPVKDLLRVGASDVTFSTPGSKGDDIFFQLTDKAGFGMRCYAHQGTALLAPAKAVVLSGITNV